MRDGTRRLLLWLGSWVAAAGVLWLASRGMDWRGAWLALSGAHPVWLFVAIAANLSIILLWAGLWQLLLPRANRVRYARMFEIVATASAIMNTIPALVGHASAVALLVRHGGLPLRAAGTVITLDQVGEGVSKLAVIAVAVWMLGVPDWMAAAGWTVAAGVAGLVAAVTLVAAFGGLHIRGTRVGRALDGIRDDLRHVRSPSRAARAIGVALLMKGAEAAAIACVILALGIDVPSSAAFVVLGAVNLATMLPVTPGNIGTYEVGAIAAYRWLGVSPEAALAAAVVQHACFMVPAVGTGVVWAAARGTTAMRELVQRTVSRRGTAA